ncbi:transposase [Streptomyces zagrosensis]|uniref:Transposase DDE domain-containing protein n=1 Tax=Streptomyces zagrosensis TaxID=1042984 RepID=A0A7W9V0V1_9ACTN|nr:transposase [Streptomyces zagrosensis]MBB5938613.1 hypothetical protein [Streptomyces zagrosensis]
MPGEGRLHPHRRPEVSFLPRELYDIQSESRTEQQTQEWLSRYSLRAAIEGTINEFVSGHGMRRCRYRSEETTHVQHVLTAIAVNLLPLAAL